LVFAKVLGPQTKVGVVGCIPMNYTKIPWWKSSERAKDVLTESFGFLAEALLNSGRALDDSSHTGAVTVPGN
jgi:hypothetical protein